MFRRLLYFWDTTSFYLDRKVYYAGYGIAAIFVLSFFLPALHTVAFFLLLALLLLVFVDALLLYQKRGISARRLLPERFSNGDENKVVIELRNNYGYNVPVVVIEELPQ
ncbi:MAG TPA: hypothetical protein VEY10_09135, partial [Flavisolibacter sp.]|nr:hypothetical protein [Flavisolibacter sp.]